MGPHRILHNSKGYVTETVYDPDSRRFVERPFPPPAAPVSAETPGPATPPCDYLSRRASRDFHSGLVR
jgi:hypothetical protein